MKDKSENKFKSRTVNHETGAMGVQPQTDETRAAKHTQDRGKEIERRAKASEGFNTLAERVARNSVYFRNHLIPGLRDHFKKQGKLSARLWCAGKFFPYAHGGPLYIEEPRSEQDTTTAHEKAEVLRKLGFRVVVIEQGSSFEDVMQTMIEEGTAAA